MMSRDKSHYVDECAFIEATPEAILRRNARKRLICLFCGFTTIFLLIVIILLSGLRTEMYRRMDAHMDAPVTGDAATEFAFPADE